MVGSTNSLLLQQRDRYADLLVNLDENSSITIFSPSLRTALALSAADRRWIDFLTQTVVDSWDPDNPSRPQNLGYAGSEEFIRLQFEEYILALLSSTSFRTHSQADLQSTANRDPNNDLSRSLSNQPQDPTGDFNPDFISAWSNTSNYALFHHLTSNANIYDIISPAHPTAGGLSVEDVQRRLAQQVADLHLDERMREGREMVNRGIASGRERMNKFWAEVEARRLKGQERRSRRSRSRSKSRTRKSAEENGPSSPATTKGRTTEDEKKENGRNIIINPSASPPQTSSPTSPSQFSSKASTWATALRERASKVQMQRPDTSQMQASARENAAKAQAYLSSWGSWAKERGREWQESRRSGGKSDLSPQQQPPLGLRGGTAGVGGEAVQDPTTATATAGVHHRSTGGGGATEGDSVSGS